MNVTYQKWNFIISFNASFLVLIAMDTGQMHNIIDRGSMEVSCWLHKNASRKIIISGERRKKKCLVVISQQYNENIFPPIYGCVAGGELGMCAIAVGVRTESPLHT